MYNFRMRGIVKEGESQEAREALFKNGRLSGDKILVHALKSRAMLYEIRGEAIDGYIPEDYTTDAKAIILLMREVCHCGQIWGNYPKWR